MKIRKLLIPLTFLSISFTNSYAQGISITSIDATESTCEANGTMTVNASGGSGASGNYRYSIIAPSCCTRDLQTSNIFTGLQPETYSVVATDIVDGSSDTVSQTIIGSYTTMSPTGTITGGGTCVEDGAVLTIDIIGGTPPYQYELTAPTSTGLQTANTFTDLTYGTTYTYRVWDSCGNFQTRTVTPMTNDNGIYTVAKTCLQRTACDTYAVTYNITATAPETHKYPYTLEFTNPDGSLQTHTISSGTSSGTLADTFIFTGVSGDFFGLSVTNTCGSNNIDEGNTSLSSYLDMIAVGIPQCDGTYDYKFDRYDNATASICDRPSGDDITYILLDPGGTEVASQTNDSYFSGFPAGSGYKIVRSTSCGNDTLEFNWSASPPVLQVTSTLTSRNVCKEHAVSVSFTVTGAIGAVKAILVSGPSSITFEDGSIHNYTYPDTITNYINNQAINYLGVGVYSFNIVDACGNTVTRSINVTSTRSTTASFAQVDGCVNSNKINWEVSSNTNVNTGRVVINPGGYTVDVNGSSGSGTYGSLASGTYVCSFEYESGATSLRYLSSMSGYSCDVIYDTIVIAPYNNPYFTGPSVTHCSGSENDLLLIPDLTKGVPPFQYEITAGPVLKPAQSSPFFPGLPLGTYTFRMFDACGNSYTQNKQVEELTTVTFETFGNTCEGGTAQFAVPHSDYITYTWTKPDGSTFTGDTLTISPVTAADTGMYDIQMAVDVEGCVDTTYFSQHLADFCDTLVLPVTFTIFYARAEGKQALLSWKTAAEHNNKGFIVERSADGRYFSQIGVVASKADGGNSRAILSYNFYDKQPLAGRNFYRLKQVDIDGKYDYSQIVTVVFGAGQIRKIFPNPANDIVTIETGSNSKVIIFNIVGQQVNVPLSTEGNKTIADISSLLPGNYTIQIIDGTATEIHKLTVNR